MEDHQYENTCKCLLLCVAYAANVGGTGSITGTGPNLVLKGISEDVFTRHGLAGPINFTSWFIYGLPASVICLILTWIWLQVLFLRCRFAEIEVGCLFVILAFLWLFRKPEFIPGWGSLLAQRSFATDSTPALFIAIVLFALPSKRPEILCWRPKDGNAVSHPAVLEWEPAVKKFPWGIVLLLGGGFALADACQKSGLSQLLGDQLVIFNEIPSWALQMIVTTLVAALTEVTSNTATATILLPIMAGLAESTGKNPLFLMLPTTLACSYAFMLPVATPPNAIAFAYGHLRVVDMAKTGLMLNILCILVATLATHTWGMAYFKLDVLPWTDVNVTTIQPTTTAGMFTT